MHNPLWKLNYSTHEKRFSPVFFPLPSPMEQHLSLLDIGKEWSSETRMSSSATCMGDTGDNTGLGDG